MKDILRLGSTLFAICAIAALALGVTDNITKPIIEERNIQANNESRKEVLSSAEEFKIVEDTSNDLVKEVYEGLKSGKVVGYTIKTSPKGYGGPIEVMVGISSEGNITGIKIGNHSETPGLGSKASEPRFKDQFNNKSVDNPLIVVKGSASSDNNIVAISGATITSNAVTTGVNAAMNIYKEVLSGEESKETLANSNVNPREKIFKDANLKEIQNNLDETVIATYEVLSGGENIGYIIETKVDGFDSKSEVIVGITLDGKIKGIELGENTRKNQYFSSTFDTGLKHQIDGKVIGNKFKISDSPSRDNEIQVVSGATITCNSVINGLNTAINAFNQISGK